VLRLVIRPRVPSAPKRWIVKAADAFYIVYITVAGCGFVLAKRLQLVPERLNTPRWDRVSCRFPSQPQEQWKPSTPSHPKTNAISQGGDDVRKTKGPLGPLLFGILSVVVGIIAGIGAVAFRGLIAFFHNIFFLGKLSVVYDANVHTPPSPWGWLIVLVPVAGALGVAFLVKNFAPEAKGHGVPEVMDAIYYNKGIIRPLVAVIKSLASALSIGTGGSVGREGPIIQIGASFGSTMGQWLPMTVWQRITLIAAGAGGGIAATFNTPIGGVLFAAEIMMHEISARTLVPVALSTVTATYIGRLFFGDHPSFIIPKFETPYFQLTDPAVLPSYVVLGVVVGVVSAIFIRSIYGFEDFFERRVRGNYYVRHAAGMFVVGVTMYALMVAFGHYYVEGVGYATVQDILSSKLTAALLLLLLFALKLFVTSMTLGSGASGGIFSPCLFMGATLGAAYGFALQELIPAMPVNPPAFAVAGMAGMVGGSTGAAMAAIVMIFEMTLDYRVIIPMTITVALSYGVRRALSRESIYTLKLVRRGHYMPEALHTDFHHVQHARDVMDMRFATVKSSDSLGEIARIAAEQEDVAWFLVSDETKLRGFVTKEAALSARSAPGEAATAGEIADTHFVTVGDDATLFDVMDTMRVGKVAVALVTDGTLPLSPDKVRGLISKQQIGDTLADAVAFYSDHRD
jgi:CIC family chloride channel protein